tara:strand:- start:275 stop:1012 length:738 start_codon:yes stop_codon:yes gene_type:complete
MYKKKNVIITGVNGHLGKNLAKRLLKDEFFVVGIDVIKSKEQNYNLYYNCDITNEINIKKVFSSLQKKKIFPDILINNAGVGAYGNIEKRSTKEIKKVMDVNLLGTINMIKYFYKFSKKTSKIKKIINISSIYGNYSPNFDIYGKNNPRYSSEIYGATKAGILQLTKYFARNFQKDNIIVNSISPGGIINKKLQTKKFIKNYIENVPLGRMAEIEDIVEPIVFLCSEKSNYINGNNILIDGGLSC